MSLATYRCGRQRFQVRQNLFNIARLLTVSIKATAVFNHIALQENVSVKGVRTMTLQKGKITLSFWALLFLPGAVT